jgi:hypothetical protein
MQNEGAHIKNWLELIYIVQNFGQSSKNLGALQLSSKNLGALQEEIEKPIYPGSALLTC